MVSSWHHKVHPGIVRVHHFVFWPVEDGVVDRQHGGDSQHLLRTLIPARTRRNAYVK